MKYQLCRQQVIIADLRQLQLNLIRLSLERLVRLLIQKLQLRLFIVVLHRLRIIIMLVGSCFDL